MKFLVALILVALIALGGVFGYSWSRNPDLDAAAHASAVGATLASPFSTRSWRGLSCPHRSIVINLAIQSLAPRLCGTESDGGAKARAERFRTEGPTSCWALYDMLDTQNTERFADELAGGGGARSPAANEICIKAKALLAQ